MYYKVLMQYPNIELLILSPVISFRASDSVHISHLSLCNYYNQHDDIGQQRCVDNVLKREKPK